MSMNEVFRIGDALSLKVGTGVKSGEPVICGKLVGVAETDSGDLIGTDGRSNLNTSNASGYASVRLDGVFKLDVQSTASTAEGLPVYIKADRTLTTTATGNTLFGHLLNAMAAGTTKQVVRLAGYSV